jgi:hypothetical protein
MTHLGEHVLWQLQDQFIVHLVHNPNLRLVAILCTIFLIDSKHRRIDQISGATLAYGVHRRPYRRRRSVAIAGVNRWKIPPSASQCLNISTLLAFTLNNLVKFFHPWVPARHHIDINITYIMQCNAMQYMNVAMLMWM